MKQQVLTSEEPDEMDEIVKTILGRCLPGTLAYRQKYGDKVEGKD